MPQDFEQLLRQHGARIRRIARRYAASGAADDLVQDILLRLWRSYPSYRADAKIETWIYRLALNACMTHLSNSIRHRDLQAASTAKSATAETAAAGASPGDILSSFLGQLGDVDASILMMYLDGLTPDEMSAVLGITGNAISVRINRLKQKFTDAYVD
jgi:RNA polymerase sigma-70 factor (ECF subfamily)